MRFSNPEPPSRWRRSAMAFRRLASHDLGGWPDQISSARRFGRSASGASGHQYGQGLSQLWLQEVGVGSAADRDVA